jgi:hypothetical protein
MRSRRRGRRVESKYLADEPFTSFLVDEVIDLLDREAAKTTYNRKKLDVESFLGDLSSPTVA